MAKALIDFTSCDWHAALPEAPAVPANQERNLSPNAKVDLCDPCSWLFDLVYPRRDSILPMLRPDVLDSFYRSARDSTPPARRAPAQLALAASEAAPEAGEAPKPAGARRKQAKPGAWKEGVVQVRCPLSHRTGSPKKYWVDLRNRTGHAKSHSKGGGEFYEGPDVAFILQDGEEFTHFCTEHAACAKAGGYGFIGEDGLRAHLTKCTSWPKATKEDKDAAETRRAA
ncbi:hypothetical protein ACWD7Y_04830 [Streptomyces drozdowiczii]